MAISKGDAADETWRLEEPDERRDRLERYAREQRKHTAWLATTGVLLIVTGIGAPICSRLLRSEAEDRGSGLCFADLGAFFLALIPVGLMRLMAVCLAPGDGLRRAFSKHPVLKVFAIILMFWLPGVIVSQSGSRKAESPEEPRHATTVVSTRPAGQADVPQDGMPAENNDDSGVATGAVVAVALFVIGAFLMLLSMHPGTTEPAYY